MPTHQGARMKTSPAVCAQPFAPVLLLENRSQAKREIIQAATQVLETDDAARALKLAAAVLLYFESERS